MTQAHKQMDEAVRLPVILVTGPSGAGRSTAVRALEDLGFEVIDNPPLSLLPRLLDAPPSGRPLALGVDVRNRDFGPESLLGLLHELRGRADLDTQMLYLDASEDTLVRRYSETRRRHPLAPEQAPMTGVAYELAMLGGVREHADVLISTTDMTPHMLKAEISRLFGHRDGGVMGGGDGSDHDVRLADRSPGSFKRGHQVAIDLSRFSIKGQDPAVEISVDDLFQCKFQTRFLTPFSHAFEAKIQFGDRDGGQGYPVRGPALKPVVNDRVGVQFRQF